MCRKGTLVDVFGNVLDINRNVINIPDASSIETDNADKAKKGLKKIYDYHRRSVKLHYEINSRKDIDSASPPENDKSRDNARNFSKWSVDVDGEGLTKLNIPASSNTGNIPILARYLNTSNISQERESAESRRDVRVKSFGVDSLSIGNEEYIPKAEDGSTVTVGTAYHNILEVAKAITGDDAVASSVNNKIGGDKLNAGGRSLHANLDGSMEISIGSDNADNKSIVLDTEGGIISSIGKDERGRSIVQETDGDVIINIGGGTQSNGKKGGSPDGKLEIHVSRGEGATAQKIIIDQSGMTLDVQGNLMLRSSGDMALDSGGRLLLNGELVFIYGSVEENTRAVAGVETLIVRCGSPQFT
jgi:hypothetical protein